MMVMLLLAGLAPLVVLATGVVANPSLARDSVLSVPISKRTNFDGIHNFAKRDREHLRNLVKRGCQQRQSSTVNKTPDIPLNNTGGIYTVIIGIGEPPTNCECCKFLPRMVSHILAQDQLLLDSGSAVTWVGANKPYVKTKSSVNTNDFAVSIALHGLRVMTQLNLNLVRQNATYDNGFFTGKSTSQEPI
jgi:cathepsin E